MSAPGLIAPVRVLGRYALFDEIASGGMATVHFGRLIGPVGFSRTVAIKRLHGHFAKDPEFSAGFVDEARLAARIHHPNVVPIVDVLAFDGELSLVMDYVEGDSLAKLLRQAILLEQAVPLGVASSIVGGGLYGLHAAHEAKSEFGEPLGIVHRDVSPQNVLVGTDGIPRIVDFGVAKAAQRIQTTADGQVKGKIAYMAPEQIRCAEVSRQTDLYAMGVVLWELLAGRRLFKSENHANLMTQVMAGEIEPPSRYRPDCPGELDALVLRALHLDPKKRFETARDMAIALQRIAPPVPQSEVGDWVVELAPHGLNTRRRMLSYVESSDLTDVHEDSSKPIVHLKTGVFGSFEPPNPDEETRAERRSSSDDTTQAVTDSFVAESAALRSRSRGGLFLWLGAAAILALVIVLFGAFGPTPENERAAAGNVTPKAATEPSRGTETLPPSTTPPVPAAASGTAVGASASSASSAGPATPAVPSSSAPVKSPPVTTSSAKSGSTATTKSKEACPKFFIDAEGIQRVNRKCW